MHAFRPLSFLNGGLSPRRLDFQFKEEKGLSSSIGAMEGQTLFLVEVPFM